MLKLYYAPRTRAVRIVMMGFTRAVARALG